MIKALLILITSLPEILRLIELIANAMKENEVQGKVKNGIKTIHEALASGDSDKLNSVFNAKQIK